MIRSKEKQCLSWTILVIQIIIQMIQTEGVTVEIRIKGAVMTQVQFTLPTLFGVTRFNMLHTNKTSFNIIGV